MSFFSKLKKGLSVGGKIALRSSTSILLGRYDRLAFDIISDLSNKNKGVPLHDWKDTARSLLAWRLKQEKVEFTDTGLEILLNMAFDAVKCKGESMTDKIDLTADGSITTHSADELLPVKPDELRPEVEKLLTDLAVLNTAEIFARIDAIRAKFIKPIPPRGSR